MAESRQALKIDELVQNFIADSHEESPGLADTLAKLDAKENTASAVSSGALIAKRKAPSTLKDDSSPHASSIDYTSPYPIPRPGQQDPRLTSISTLTRCSKKMNSTSASKSSNSSPAPSPTTPPSLPANSTSSTACSANLTPTITNTSTQRSAASSAKSSMIRGLPRQTPEVTPWPVLTFSEGTTLLHC